MGSVGLPGQVSFMATNMPVTQADGLPVEPLGLLLAVDTIPDVFATVGNVTADLTATGVVARQAQHGADALPPRSGMPAILRRIPAARAIADWPAARCARAKIAGSNLDPS